MGELFVELKRVGTTYIPVHNPKEAAEWYKEKLNAKVNYLDEHKVILDLANQSFFLVKTSRNETSNFKNVQGAIQYSLTFEVNGVKELETLRNQLIIKGVYVGEIENRGHAGRNFVFQDLHGNLFDVWSELSSAFQQCMQ